MPGGHASHKSTSPKPNTNANGRIDTAADLSVEPADLLDEGVDARRAEEESPENAAATQRPNQGGSGQEQQ
ncbi:hypothetical protein H6F78_22205 [Coleofasciculus sp. FACHB-64]|uniref:hypothetical protein n=1 Tax=Cyanophyceae TaxID=3028117 RepID=UPI0016882DD5|nr:MULTISPECIES: hypothetical protein [unclassified Coleofasciculus]MBD1881765.1 hypothetical protein [Coleofasciculus sp. FACHB-T130]MBD1892554.1 hypothetical protein [Coleofasciculus sp. FACHB-SPT9]MBD1895786.1 hypothetical protein [Coleofasciculus sp. FACHB-129]MBD1900638.1 hypothetical protein [Coleofasciculus sp. FACHB-125]MBD1942243.1 hypothetical protein [Coleofasciculus sp. FACHB-712]